MLVGVKSHTPRKYQVLRNEVSLTKAGIILKVFRGDQTVQSIKEFREETEKLIEGLRAKEQKVLVLVDLSHLGKTTVFARSEEIESIRSLDFDKAAVFGSSFINRKMAEIIVHFSGMEYKIKFFNSEKEAESWLINR